jgi:hypothetical protein
MSAASASISANRAAAARISGSSAIAVERPAARKSRSISIDVMTIFRSMLTTT